MSLRVHHVSFGTMCPVAARWLRDPALPAGVPDPAGGKMCCHGLVVETDAGLVLVDTGMGLDDIADPSRLGSGFGKVARPICERGETAVGAVERLGFTVDDVRHVVVTHLDLDHAGGLPDFPKASVHLLAAEHDAAIARRTMMERNRYRPVHFAHGPSWERYTAEGEPFFGFECVRALRGLPPEILLVPLSGHSRGHAGVVVEAREGFLLHAGDAYFFRGEMDPLEPRCPVGLRVFQRIAAVDPVACARNRERLRALSRDHGPGAGGEGKPVRVFSAHDPVELEASKSWALA